MSAVHHARPFTATFRRVAKVGLIVAATAVSLPGAAALADLASTSVPMPTMTDGFADLLASHAAGDQIDGFVHFRAGLSDADQAVIMARAGFAYVRPFDTIDVSYAIGSVAQFEAMAANSRVEHLQDNAELTYFGDTAVQATNVTSVRAKPTMVDGSLSGSLDGSPYLDAQGRPLDGTGVGVAIVDSGIDGTHPDLQNHIGRNLKVVCSTPGLVSTTTGMCYGGHQMVEMQNSDTSGGHGTHVSGIVAGDGTASQGTFVGVAPGVTLYGISTGEGISVLYATEAYDWIIKNHDKVNPPIKLVNNSWGCDGGCAFDPTDATNKLVNQAADLGITSFFAMGNSGGDGTTDNTSGYATNPKPGVVGVANYSDRNTGTRDGVLYSGSSRAKAGSWNNYPDVSAPGASITSTCRHGGAACDTGPSQYWQPYYAILYGTSMATPHALGVAALMLQASPSLTPTQIEDTLKATAHKYVRAEVDDGLNVVVTNGGAYTPDQGARAIPSGTTSYDKGYGLVDALAAIEALGATRSGYPVNGAALSITSPAPASSVPQGNLTVTGEATNAGRTNTSLTLGANDAGDYRQSGDLDLDRLTVDQDGSGVTYRITVRDLSDDNGVYYPQFTVFSNVGGTSRATSIIGSASGMGPDPDDDPTFNTAKATSVVTAGNTMSVFVPWANLGDPAPGAVVANVRVASYGGPVRDVIPGGTSEDFVSRLQFAPRFTVKPVASAEPIVSAVRVWADGLPKQSATINGATWTANLDLRAVVGNKTIFAEYEIDGVVRRTASTTLTVEATGPVLTTPSAPQGLDAVIGSPASVGLSWAAPASTGGAPVSGYRVYRDNALIATVPATQANLIDEDVVEGGTYTYKVRATNVAGTGPAASVTVTLAVDPNAPDAPVITGPSTSVVQAKDFYLSGTAGPGLIVEVTERGALLGRATVDADGAWKVDVHLTDGTHQVAAFAKDGQGLRSAAALETFVVDGIVPTVQLQTIDGSKFLGKIPEIKGRTFDDRAVATVRLGYVHSHYAGFNKVTTPTCTGCGTAEATFVDHPSLMPGYYTVYALVTDVAGNSSYSKVGIYVVSA